MRPTGPQRFTGPPSPTDGKPLPSTGPDPLVQTRSRLAEGAWSRHPARSSPTRTSARIADKGERTKVHHGDARWRRSRQPATGSGELGCPGEAAVLDPRFVDYRATGDRAIRNALVEDHRWLARHCVRRFKNTNEPIDDLIQVAIVGLVKAVDRFDPARGFAFTTFAVPTITGELRRHFRDRTWAVRVPRRLKDHHLIIKNGADQLQHTLGRSPTIPELAAHCCLTTDETLEALEAGNAYRGVPLISDHDDDPNDDTEPLAVDEPGYATSEARMVVPNLLAALPSERERQIIKLRFVDNMSQSQIAAELGLSQVHISRLLRASLDLMRQRLTPDPRR